MVIIPDDVIFFYILTRLPIKTLLRFRCSSKLWLNTIDSSEFKEAHMKFSTEKFIHHNPSWIFTRKRMNLSQFRTEAKILYVFSPQKCYSSLPRSFQIRNLYGSARGLVCLRLFKEDVGVVLCLCNASTRNYKILPKEKYGSDPNSSNNYGFGYDNIQNDYKVIHIVRSSIVDRYRKDFNIYSFKYDKWNFVESKLLNSILRYSELMGQGFLHGHTLHWRVDHNVHFFQGSISYPLNPRVKTCKDTTMIFTIDLTTEKERLLSIPEDFRTKNMVFGSFNGNLCVSSYKTYSFDIWVMRESWTKVKIEIPGINFKAVIKYSETENLIVVCDKHYDLYWSDVDTKIFYKTPSSRTKADYFGDFFPYIETLISPFSSYSADV